jgi:hypothetical protein
MVIIPDRTNKEESSDDCNELNFAHLNEVKEIKQDCRTDLTDFTFLIPMRIDSEKRRRFCMIKHQKYSGGSAGPMSDSYTLQAVFSFFCSLPREKDFLYWQY